jgi:serine/threonine protein kinase
MEELVGTTIGGCKILEKIGHGGMGTVYKAHHLALDIIVAVKVLKPLSDVPDAKERFLREARIAAKLRHPNIIGVTNVGCENGVHFIVMDYIDGKTLQTIISDKGKIEPQEAVRIAMQVLSALQLALKNGIVHRDIKPENIMIDKTGTAKLADLGLARIDGDIRLTLPNVMLGSPHYAAPEQTENPSAADCRSDIYALGCTLYHMLAGSPPFPGKSIVDVIVKHMHRPVPVLKENVPSIPGPLSDVVEKMMQKEPDKRFQTPSEVIEALNKSFPDIFGAQYSSSENISASKAEFKPALLWSLVAGGIIVTVLLLFLLMPKSEPDSTSEPVPVADTITDSEVTSEETADVNDKKSTETKDQKRKKTGKQKSKPGPVAVSSAEAKVKVGENPLLPVVKIGDTETLRRMLSEGVSPRCEKGAATTPLHEAVRRGLTVETQLLLQHGADPNARDKKGDTPLHYAVRENAFLIVSHLLENGADPNLADHKGKPPLRTAELIDTELERLLLKYGAK